MDQLHRHTYNAMRGTPGNEAMPYWDDLPEWVRSAMLAVQLAERKRCMGVAHAEYDAIDKDPDDYIGKERWSDAWKQCSTRIAMKINELR